MSGQAPAMDPAAAAAMQAAMEAGLRTFNTELWTLYAFGVAFTALRTYARVKAVGIQNLRGDDYLVWIAVVIYTIQSTLAFFAVNHGQGLANNGLTGEQRALLDPGSVEFGLRIFGSKIQVVGWTTYVCLIGVLKIAVLVFYVRLMEGLNQRFRMRIWIGFGLVGATIFASLVTIYSSCRPFHRYWQIRPDPGNHCQAAVSSPIVWVTFSSSVITDLYLLTVPLPMLWGTTLKLAKKIAVSLVLGAGVFVLVCSLLKTIFVEIDPINGAQLAGVWGTREAFTSVITTNLPMIFPLVKAWLKPFLGSSFASTRTNSKHPDGFKTIGGGGTSSGLGRSRKSARYNTDTTLGHSDSEERIVKDIKMHTLEVYAGPGPHSVPPVKGIMVSKEMSVVEDQVSEHESRHGDYNSSRKMTPESW